MEDRKLVQVRPETKEAVFENAKKQQFVEKFDLLHVIPPMSAIPAVRENKKLSNNEGWLTVSRGSLTHTSYPNIFGCGSTNDINTIKSFYTSALQSFWTSKALFNVMYNHFRLRSDHLGVSALVAQRDFRSWLNSPIYEGDGVEAVHFSKERLALSGIQDGKPLRHDHFPYVWQYKAPDTPNRVTVLDKYWDQLTIFASIPFNNDEVFNALALDNPPVAENEILQEWTEL